MPKVVDRDQERRAIGAALLALAAERGLDAVSVRTVAARAGRSAGAVQKYFRTKNEMLGLALEMVAERTEQRLDEVDRSGTPVQVLRRLVLATLPLDPERRAEALVWAAFAVAAVHHPEFADVLRQVDDAVSADLARWLAGRTDDPQRAADAVLAISDGLTLRLLYAPETAADLLPALDVTLAALLNAETTPPAPGGG